RDGHVTGVQTCALPISLSPRGRARPGAAHVRGGDRGRAREDAGGGGAARAGTRLFQPRLVGLHLSRPRPLRRAARALAGGLPARSEERRVGKEGWWRRW